MRILLIDNEPIIRSILKDLIENWSKGLHQIEEADGVVTGISQISKFSPDIIFLDVEMNDGTGFDLLNQLHNNFHLDIFLEFLKMIFRKVASKPIRYQRKYHLL
jgi:two-component system LytT family response regulator